MYSSQFVYDFQEQNYSEYSPLAILQQKYQEHNDRYEHWKDEGYRYYCKRGREGIAWCDNKWCPIHGREQRRAYFRHFMLQPIPLQQCFACSCTFGLIFDSKSVTTAKNLLIDNLRKAGFRTLTWAVHFNQMIPDLHLTNSYYTNLRNLPSLFRSYWLSALEAIGHPEPTKQTTSCDEVRDWHDWHSYIYRTKYSIPRHKCPPAVKGNRWQFCAPLKALTDIT